MIESYWATKVWSTGGTESTKNKTEQTNFEESRWVMEGVNKGLKELYSDRYDDDGNLLASCTDPTSLSVSYGDDACKTIIENYVAANSSPTAPCQGEEACNAAISCFAGNDATGTNYTSTDNCDLVQLKYGYSQW